MLITGLFTCTVGSEDTGVVVAGVVVVGVVVVGVVVGSGAGHVLDGAGTDEPEQDELDELEPQQQLQLSLFDNKSPI